MSHVVCCVLPVVRCLFFGGLSFVVCCEPLVVRGLLLVACCFGCVLLIVSCLFLGVGWLFFF